MTILNSGTSDIPNQAIRDLAGKAADQIRLRGWYQGDYGSDASDSDNCPVCLLGAIYAELLEDPFTWWSLPDHQKAQVNALCDVMGKIIYGDDYDQYTYSIAKWNDADDRTVEEVLALLDGIAMRDNGTE